MVYTVYTIAEVANRERKGLQLASIVAKMRKQRDNAGINFGQSVRNCTTP